MRCYVELVKRHDVVVSDPIEQEHKVRGELANEVEEKIRLEEIDRIIKIGKILNSKVRNDIITLLREYHDIFS